MRDQGQLESAPVVMSSSSIRALALALVFFGCACFFGWRVYVPWRAMNELQQLEKQMGNSFLEIDYRHPKWIDRWTGKTPFIPFVDVLEAVEYPESSMPIVRILDHIGTFQEVRWIRLGTCDVDDAFLSRIENLQHLWLLEIRGKDLTDTGMRSLGRIKSLKVLSIYNTSVTDEGLAHLTELRRLEELRIIGSQCVGPGLGHLATVTSLKHIGLTRYREGTSGFGRLNGFPDDFQQEFPSEDRRATTRSLEMLRSLPNLTALMVPGLPVDDQGAAQIGMMTNLFALDLSGTAVTDKGFLQLGQLVSLGFLKVDSTRMTDQGLRVVQEFPHLEVLGYDCGGITIEGEKWLLRVHPKINDLHQ